MEILVGNTGFVGGNLADQHHFDALFNSSNIQDAFGAESDLCVYSGVRAEMFLANANPAEDLKAIHGAIENIRRINPKKIVLISTVAVYDRTVDVDEDWTIDDRALSAYGRNRLHLERWVEQNFENRLIVRLPALFGKKLKKNFIYDMIHIAPALLTKEKFEELAAKDHSMRGYYAPGENGFYRCCDFPSAKPVFERAIFNALSFTDSRSVYQFYGLENLWGHISELLSNVKIRLVNLVTEPLSAAEIYAAVFGKEFTNTTPKPPFHYDIKTRSFESGYVFDRHRVLRDIVRFVEENSV